ncbi:hypothetical protein [Butyrivibrio sp. AE3006]|uniref:hypothetical protein n=1 Tax=Butyrivibrio sp. AE3006 TaxID=1280673 RepID=UPI000423CD92|nr:hypothetical protein [Butyrivibrio sp. AE3006]
MGRGYICKCEKCGYTLNASLGSGMFYPQLVKDEIENMKKGHYGEQGRKFFEEHPDGSISCESVVSRCTKCGNLEPVYDLNLMIPDPEIEQKRQTLMDGINRGDSKFTSLPEDMVRSIIEIKRYVFYEKYDHHCSKCGSKAEIIDEFIKELRQEKIICPECGGIIKEHQFLCWD